jgi:hypothetical protein
LAYSVFRPGGRHPAAQISGIPDNNLMHDDELHLMQTQHLLALAEEELRARVLAVAPDIRHAMYTLENVLREMIKDERDKRGLEKYIGTLTLNKNEEKKTPAQPDLVGTGYVAGRQYTAEAWFRGLAIKVELKQPLTPLETNKVEPKQPLTP